MLLAEQLHVLAASNTSLRALDLSCNVISEEGGWQLREGLAQNTTLQVSLPLDDRSLAACALSVFRCAILAHGLLASQTLDLRLNQVSVETVAAIEGICKKNKLDAQRARRELFEAQRLAEKQPI